MTRSERISQARNLSMNEDRPASSNRVAANSGIGLVVGAALGSVVGAFFGNLGIGLIFGGIAGIVLGPGIGMAVGKHPETPDDSQPEQK